MNKPVRNPATVIDALREAMASPRSRDMRVAQVISNALMFAKMESKDIFYVEDEALIKALKAWNWRQE